MAIKVGDVVFHKASGEPGFVLGIGPITSAAPTGVDLTQFSGMQAVVRSPKGSDRLPTEYALQTFLVEELETAAERLSREQDQMAEIFERGQHKATGTKAMTIADGTGFSN